MWNKLFATKTVCEKFNYNICVIYSVGAFGKYCLKADERYIIIIMFVK